MLPFAQFDPASLAIWTTTGALTDPTASLADEAMSAASAGGPVGNILRDLAESTKSRLLWLASSVWHEKRHFFDTCLTNYGSRRFRDFFTLAANFAPLAAHARKRGEPIWLPIEVYACPVKRSLFEISTPPDNVLKAAQLARVMKTFAGQLDAPLSSGEGRSLHLGGAAQMEGLAQVSQIHCIERDFGTEDVSLVTRGHVHNMPLTGEYRAIEVVSGFLGSEKRLSADVTIVNPGLASAMFFTALCGRFFGAGSTPEANLVAPSERLSRMILELGSGAGRYDMSDAEAGEVIDRLARRLWGRTAFEEIAADIEAMDARFNRAAAPWLAEEGLVDVYDDFLDLRRRLLAAAISDGLASVLPRAFPLRWRDKLRPWHVVATPTGTADADGETVFGAQFDVPKELELFMSRQVTWAALRTERADDRTNAFALTKHDAWTKMLRRHAPRAMLMLNGRNHRRMVPPELEQPLRELESDNVRVRFHPRFEWPDLRAAECSRAT
jgi:hypothetical protein